MRINRALSAYLSRRRADIAIKKGSVTVNGKIATLGSSISPSDIMKLDGKTLRNPYEESDLYLKYWKPCGVECSEKSIWKPHNKTYDIHSFAGFGFDPALHNRRVFTIGRLDKESSGLILLTTNGLVAQALMRGRGKDTEKEYVVALDRALSPSDAQTLRDGVEIQQRRRPSKDGKQRRQGCSLSGKAAHGNWVRTQPCQVYYSAYQEDQCPKIQHALRNLRPHDLSVMPKRPAAPGDHSRPSQRWSRWPSSPQPSTPWPYQLGMILHQGLNRQIHRMLERVGCKVVALHRLRIGPISLQNLLPGQWSLLTPEEQAALLRLPAVMAAGTRPGRSVGEILG